MNSNSPTYTGTQFRMEPTMRWFGPDDPVSLRDIAQAGCSGIVTALHHLNPGEIWPLEEIKHRILEIEKWGLKWSVAESLPVHESIKTRTMDFEGFIENYKASIMNLGQLGIKTITYNFMPVLDWTRTQLFYTLPNGAKALYFEKAALEAFDLFILKRAKAFEEIPSEDIHKAESKFLSMNIGERKELEENILAGLPGAETHFNLESFQEALLPYQSIDKDQLRENLIKFLEEIMPVCDRIGVNMAIHPDDPPFSLFGLPRIMCNEDDFSFLADRIPSQHNGICFCTGSLGVLAQNDLVQMIKRFKERIHFVHLRNTRRNPLGDFYEENHLDGDVDMYAVIRELVELMRERQIFLPMRPDHGHQILDDLGKNIRPGYSAIGRLKGLAEIRGLEIGILRSISN